MRVPPGRPIAEIVEDNTADFFIGLGRANGSEVCDRRDVKCAFAGSGFNRVLGSRFPASRAEAIVGHVVAMLDARGIDALWYVGPYAPLGLAGVLATHGFARRSAWMSMAMDLNACAPDVDGPAGLEVREAEGADDLDRWAGVVIASYGFDDVRRGYGRHLTAPGNAGFRRHLYLGLLDGRAVATTVLYEGEEVAGIYWVGTLPGARRRGIASAMTRHALREAKAAGYGLAVLNASAAGQPLYRRLGFADHFTTPIYHRPAPQRR